MTTLRRLRKRLRLELRRVAPGDVVVLRFPRHWRPERIGNLMAQMNAWLVEHRPGASSIAVGEDISIETIQPDVLRRLLGITGDGSRP